MSWEVKSIPLYTLKRYLAPEVSNNTQKSKASMLKKKGTKSGPFIGQRVFQSWPALRLSPFEEAISFICLSFCAEECLEHHIV